MDELMQRFRDILEDDKEYYVLFETSWHNTPEYSPIDIRSLTSWIIDDDRLSQALIARMIKDNFPIISDYAEIKRLHISYKKTVS